MKELKVGIIGYGRSGRDIHANGLKSKEGFRIVAICDGATDRREMAARELNVPTYETYEEMLQKEQLDLVVNASYSYMHAPITADLLKKGMTVLCEKPAAKTVVELDEVLRACPGENKLFYFQQSRFAPYYQKVREVIASGVIGEVVQVSLAFNGFARRWDWQTLQDYKAGSLLNTGPHPLDQLLDLYGGDENDVPEVFCAMNRANTFGDAEDYVKLVMRGKNHVIYDLEISSCCAYPNFTYNIQGTRGGIQSTMEHMEWKYFLPEEAPEQHLIRESLRRPDGTPCYCGEQLTWHTGEWNFGDEKKTGASYSSASDSSLFGFMINTYYDHLYDTLVNDADFPVKHWQVRRQMKVMEQCHKQNSWIWNK